MAQAVNAYIYGYPLVVMKATQQFSTNVVTPNALTGQAPVNQFARAAGVPTPQTRVVVSPNVDTLYTQAWLNLRAEPIVLHVPDTRGRYFLMPTLSAWTDVIASPGTRTTGTGAGDFAITGPRWQGQLPPGVTEIRSPTDTAWILGRTQLDGPADLAAARTLADRYTLAPLSARGLAYSPPPGTIDPTVPEIPPKAWVAKLDAQAFFTALASALASAPPSTADTPMATTLAALGIVPGQSFDIDARGPVIAAALRRAVHTAQRRIRAAVTTLGTDLNGWQVTTDTGTFGTDYLRRAATAWQLLGANPPQDAVYPTAFADSTGQRLTGANRYLLHIPPGQAPPARAFWSLTLYDPQGFLVPNPIDRYAIGHTSAVVPDRDGSVDLYVQHDDPGGSRTSNWLPAPTGPFSLCLRLYWPRPSALNGTWSPPSVDRIG